VSDSNWGERPKAFVTIQPGTQMTPDDVIKFSRQHSGISRFMVPREVEIVDELPKTSTGKIKKKVLREWAKGGARGLE
jgi:acyl-CoA synthetase (AMP-forming)/AMP-acid ligase II